MAGIEINKVQLSPEVIDDFRLNFGTDASDALAKDVVGTFTQDFATQIADDPNFFSYDLLRSGEATFFDQLSPQYTMELDGEQIPIRDMLPAQRKVRFQDPDAISSLLTNAEVGSLPGAFLSEFFKSAPSVAAGTKAAQITAARTFKRPPTSIAQFALQATPPVAAFLGGSFLLYEGADALEEGLFGPDTPVLPGQKANIEMMRTLGGGGAGIQFPFLMSRYTNRAARDFLANLAEGAPAPTATRMTAAVEDMIEGMGRTAKGSKTGAGLTVFGEAVATTGSGIGAKFAEQTFPGQTLPRLGAEFLGGNTFAATVSKMLPGTVQSIRESGDPSQSFIEKAVTGKQKKLFDRMNELYELHGGDYEKMMADLNNEETRAIFSEVFPGVDFTAGQRLEDNTGIIMMVEAAMAKDNPELMAKRMTADRNAKTFFDNYIRGLIAEGSQEGLAQAAFLRRSMFNDAMQRRLTVAVDNRVKAVQKLLDGPMTARSQQEFSVMLADTIDAQLNLARKQESKLWDAVGGFNVYEPSDIIDTDFTPAFITKFDEIYNSLLPRYQARFAKENKELFDTIKDVKRQLGIDIREGIQKQNGILANLSASNPDSVNALNTFLGTKVSSGADLNTRRAAIGETLAEIKKGTLGGEKLNKAQQSTMLAAAKAQADLIDLNIARNDPDRVQGLSADMLYKLRREVLNDAVNLYSGATTRRGVANEARQFGEIAEAILEDLNSVEAGANEAYDVARDYSYSLNDTFTRSIVGKARADNAMGARRIPPELLSQQFIRGNPSVTDLRVQELQGIAEFAHNQGFEGATETFTTINNIVESAIRDARKQSVFPPGHSREGQINADALASWKRDNAELLSRFPALDQDLDNAVAAQRTFDVFDARAKEAKNIADSQTYLSTLINNTSPTAAISEALNFTPKGGRVKDPVQGLRRLFRLTSVKYRGADGKLLPPAEQTAIREKIREGYENAILQYAFMNAGGESIKTFDPVTFHKLMFGPVKGEGVGPGGPQSLVELAEQYNIMDKNQITRMRTLSNQMVRLAAADAAGKLDDPELIKEAGPIFDFYIGLVGLAGGTKAYQALTGGQGGTASISAAAEGKRFVLDMLRDQPASKRMELMQLIFADPELSATLLRPATTEKEVVNQLGRIEKFFVNRGFNVASGQQPYIIREMYEDEDRGTGATKEDMVGDQSSVDPSFIPPQVPTQPVAQPTTAVASAAPPVAPPPPPTPTGPVDRARFAAMFPEDRDLIQGIGSLMG
jgi:hypothetical protein